MGCLGRSAGVAEERPEGGEEGRSELRPEIGARGKGLGVPQSGCFVEEADWGSRGSRGPPRSASSTHTREADAGPKC